MSFSNVAIFGTAGTNDTIKPILCDENGRLIVNVNSTPPTGNDVSVVNTPNVNLNDGAGNEIGSAIVGTERGLNVNIIGGGGGGSSISQNQFFDGSNWVNASSDNTGILNTSDADTHSKLDTTNSKLDTINSTIETSNTKLEDIRINTSIISEASSQMDFVVEDGISKLQTNDAGANLKLDDINTKLIDVNDELDLQTTALQNLESKNDTIITELQNVNTNINTSNNKLDTINTTITNKHLSSTTDSIEITGLVNVGQVYGVVPVSGTFWQNTQPISGSVSVSNFPSSFQVSNTVSTFDTNTQSINNKLYNADAPYNDSIKMYQVNNPTSISIDNFPSTTSISGTVSVSNFPSNQPISGSVSISNQISGYALDSSVNTTNNKLDTINTTITNKTLNKLVDSVDISGQSVSVSNQISGYALNSNIDTTNTKLDTINTSIGTTNSKLDTIHADLDGLTYDGSSNLNVNIASGTISVGSVNIKDSNGDNITATAGSINSNITNSYLNNHMYAYHSGSWVNVVSASNGHLLVNSATQDGAGNSISSSTGYLGQTGLDVNIVNSNNIPIEIKNINLGGSNVIQTDINSFGSGITSTASGGKNSLDVSINNSSLTVSGSVSVSNQITGYALNSSVVDTNDKLTATNTKLDTANSTLTTIHNDLDGLTYDGFSNLNVVVNNPSGVTVNGTVNSNIFGSSGQTISATSQSLHTYDYNINNSYDSGASAIKTLLTAKNGSSYFPLTSNGSAGYLNTLVNNDNTTDFYGRTGLNVYQIPSRTKTFLFNAYSNNTATNASISSFGNTASFTANLWGIANPRNTWTVYRTSSSGAGTAFIFYYTYIDSSGNEVVGSPVTLTNASTYYNLASGIVTINSWYLNTSITSVDSLYINSTNSITNAWGGANVLLQNNSLWTCPNNCIAWVQNVNFYGSGAEGVRLVKWDSDGTRSIMYSWLNATNFSVSSNGEYGFGGYITAGQTIGWGGENASIVRNISANIVCRYL